MRTDRVLRVAAMVVAVVGLAAASACGSGSQAQSPGPRESTGAMEPMLVIERFLQAANANDIQTMARLFGTKQGSITKRDPKDQVEQRMFAIASILRHDDYAVEREQIVPGRIGEAMVISVRMTMGQRRISVPFTMVRTRANDWLVEQVGLERVLRGT